MRSTRSEPAADAAGRAVSAAIFLPPADANHFGRTTNSSAVADSKLVPRINSKARSGVMPSRLSVKISVGVIPRFR